MKVVPLKPLPNQIVQFVAGTTVVKLDVYRKFYGLMMDVYVGGALAVAGCLCQNQNRVIHNQYVGFPGDLVFVDTQGSSDPDVSGLGSRWSLLYLTAADVAGLGLLQ